MKFKAAKDWAFCYGSVVHLADVIAGPPGQPVNVKRNKTCSPFRKVFVTSCNSFQEREENHIDEAGFQENVLFENPATLF